MRRTSVPKALQERLGDEGTVAFVDVFNRQQDQMTDDIARAVMRALEPRFASIESRLDQCATKADLAAFATKADFAGLATKADLAGVAMKTDIAGFATQAAADRLAEKQEAFGMALERGLGGVRAELRDFATQATVDRLAEKQDAFAVALERGLGGIRAELRGFATQATVDRLSERQETFAVALERGLGGIRADMASQRADMLKWMFLFWVGQAFVVLAYLRAAA